MSRRRLALQRGVAFVEFSIVAALFFLLVMFLLDVGRAIYIKNTLDAAAREAARRGVVLNNPSTSDVESAARGHSSDVFLASPCAYSTTLSDPTTANTGIIYVSKPPSGGNGSYVPGAGCTVPGAASGHVPITVVIKYKYQPLTPLVGQFLGGGLIFTSSSTMTTEY